MSNFQVIDTVFVILIGLMVIHGYVRGLIAELFSWAAIIIAIVAGIFLHPIGAAFIRKSFMQDVRYVPEIISFAAVFLIVTMICKILERILRNVVSGAHLGTFDKILGGAFGLLEGLAIVTLVLFVLNVQPIFDSSKIIGDSVFAGLILPLIEKIPFLKTNEIPNHVASCLYAEKRICRVPAEINYIRPIV